MRYYRYGKENGKKEIEAKEMYDSASKGGHFSRLIVEEDTIYEIDEECMKCLEKKKTGNDKKRYTI